MTLLVAGANGTEAWMVADTAMTDPKLTVRDRVSEPKIFRLSSHSLVGYSGDQALAIRLIAAAAAVPPGEAALGELVKRHQALAERVGHKWKYPELDLAYAFIDGDEAHLYKISDGSCREFRTFHLGSPSAFDHFQRIKEDIRAGRGHAPRAVETLRSTASNRAAGDPKLVLLDDAHLATHAMWKVFGATHERHVGGWVMPWTLSKLLGAELLSYSYSVTDPVVDSLKTGDMIEPGTAAAGGFDFCLSRLGYEGNMVAYFLQRPGGEVLLAKGITYEIRAFAGRPKEFVKSVKEALGYEVEVWFSDHDKPRTVNILTSEILTDAKGEPRLEQLLLADRSIVHRWIHGSSASWAASSKPGLLLQKKK